MESESATSGKLCALSVSTTLAAARHHSNRMEAPRRRMRLEKVGLYVVGRAIGRGNFATVRLARHTIAKTKVALKIIDKSTLDAENMIKIEREVRILKTIDHPHIVKPYENVAERVKISRGGGFAKQPPPWPTFMRKGSFIET
ncbi:unnamed protein product [Caenorhabditis auriculariae]|uniref:non-specific serine/threonine protein kinase n=1 Tax=Caenorhabditis auriculariae TaxID=2777116 RepID=A0A8S1HFC8_9PELO|nr:unnamed protein product [Caenorhabditis auriculariae]